MSQKTPFLIKKTTRFIVRRKIMIVYSERQSRAVYIVTMVLGRAIAEAVRRWLHSVVSRVLARVW
jgi:hypothetical protein